MVGGAPISQEFADEIGADAYTEDAASAAECAKKYAESGFCAKAAAGEFDQVSVKGEESVTAGAEDKEKNIAMTDAQKKLRKMIPTKHPKPMVPGYADRFMRHLIL